MKKKWIWIVLIVAVVAITAVAVGLRLWLEAPGVRVMGDKLYVNVQHKGYVIDGETGEIVDETTVTVKGSASDSDSEAFDGELTVLGYRNTASGTISQSAVVEKTDSVFYTIRMTETCTHQETDDQNVTHNVEHILDYRYIYYLDPEDPDFLTVVIEDLEDFKAQYVVCADSKEAALEDYRWFLEHKPK